MPVSKYQMFFTFINVTILDGRYRYLLQYGRINPENFRL